MSKYTPGPWRIVRSPNCACRIESYASKGCIADVWGLVSETRAANACLIAKAPEMYEALEDVASYLLTKDDNNVIVEMVESVRSLLKKIDT